MAKRKSTRTVEALRHHDASRKNIPTAEYQAVMAKDDRDPIEVAYERRNRDLDPQLVWRGKDVQNWSDLVVQAPPLFIQEKVQPKVLIDDLRQRSREAENGGGGGTQADLFADFNGLPSADAQTEFYQHDANWSNRMILGDSLQVMASLAEREGLRGKVQCIYIDPPYGIKFNSNFQWSTTSRNVTDGKADHITREPEQVKAFRDTWRDGVHSYLTYLRDRLTVARDLLTESGSVFVQIGDENVHRVRALMDEVFGEENFVSQIMVKKTGGVGAEHIDNVFDFIVWYAKSSLHTKYREIFTRKLIGEGQGTGRRYDQIETGTFTERGLRKSEKDDLGKLVTLEKEGARFFQLTALSSESTSKATTFEVTFEGGRFFRTNWKTNVSGMERLRKSGRLRRGDRTIRFKRYLGDFPASVVANYWDDTGVSGKIYVVQTAQRVIERCVLMTTDPGDLVLDPTCGSGTTAFVAEQWGRRWITIDTSRVALALARARIMGARYPYYLLSDSRDGQIKEAEISGRWSVTGGRSLSHRNRAEGGLNTDDRPLATVFNDIRQGFVYERVPHITLRSIANNAEIDVIWEKFEKRLASLRAQLSAANGQAKTLDEWEIPRERPSNWPQVTEPLLTVFWEERIARQKEIDASIAAKADYEYLYDKPFEDRKKVRVAGPFTVESLSPHRLLGVDDDDSLIDNVAEAKLGYGEKQDFADVILDNLKNAGVQQAHKEGRVTFTGMKPWPGDLVCAEGTYADGGASPGSNKRAGIFIGPEFGTVSRPDLVEAAREAADADFDVLIACAFNYDAHATEFNKVGRIPILKARMNADLHMAEDLKNTGKGNLFVIFGEPDIDVLDAEDGQIQVKVNGVDVFHPNTGEIRSDNADGIACWFVDTDYNNESFFVRHAYFLGANDPYKFLKTTLKAEINQEAWETLHSDTSRPFPKPSSGRIAVKVINHLGDEVMKVFRV